MPPAPRAVTEDLGYSKAYEEWVPVASPAAGANAQIVVPGQFATRLIAITFRLVTDANAANRIATVDYQDGAGNTFVSSGASAVQTASLTQDYFGDTERGVAEWNTNTPVWFPIADVILMPGRIVQVTVANKQATDQLSRIFAVFERYPTGPRGYDEAQSAPRVIRARR